MLTINTILKELKDVPVNRLEELYQFVHSLTPNTKQTESLRKKILSFGGAFGDMSNKDYSDFLNQTKKARTNLFDRNIDLRNHLYWTQIFFRNFYEEIQKLLLKLTNT